MIYHFLDIIGCRQLCPILAILACIVLSCANAGSKSKMSRKQYNALVAATDTLQAPRPGEWRFETKEAGQTVAQFISGRWHKPDSIRNTIYVQPLDTVLANATARLELLRQFLRAYFMLPAKIMPVLTIHPSNIIARVNPNSNRRQLLTDDILFHIEKKLPPSAFCCIAVTVDDLYPQPTWDFVFGQASLMRRVGVVSFARYAQTGTAGVDSAAMAAKMLLRSCKVMAHETAHMFGLYHCIDYQCCMNGSNNLAESDAKPIHLCPVCLQKLQHSIGFSLVPRYNRLKAFYFRAGLPHQSSQINKRLQALQDS